MPVISRTWLAAVVFSSSTGPLLQPAEVRCAVISKVECSASGCTNVKPDSSFVLIPSLGNLEVGGPVLRGTPQTTIRRCDPRQCLALPVVAAENGSYLTFSHAYGYYLRVALTGLQGILRRGDFVEASALGTTVTSSFGTCRLPNSR
jgi:hypothetical protein